MVELLRSEILAPPLQEGIWQRWGATRKLAAPPLWTVVRHLRSFQVPGRDRTRWRASARAAWLGTISAIYATPRIISNSIYYLLGKPEAGLAWKIAGWRSCL